MNKPFITLLLLILSIFFSYSLFAQDTIHTTAGSDSACYGDQITIPIYVTDCNDVKDISIKLEYDPVVLVYQGYQNPHPALAPGFLVVNSSGIQVALAWFSPSQSVNIGTNTLIEFKFTYLGGTTSLTWDTATAGNCEYLNVGGNIIPALFFDGAVFSLGPTVNILSQPTDFSGNQGMPASFAVSDSGATSNQWQVDRNDGNGFVNCYGGVFSGALTPTLNISSTTLLMNGWQFRCIVANACSSKISDTATLTVTSLLPTIITTIDSVTACVGNQLIIPVRVQNFIDVASLSHQLTFDPAILTYVGYQNINPNLIGFFLANGVTGNFAASWFNPIVGATLPDGILYEVIFTYNGGSCCLEWDLSQSGNNEYSHISGLSFPSIWIDGCVMDGMPVVDAGPDQTISNGTNTNLNSTVTGGSGFYSYSWTPAALLVDAAVEDPTTVLLIATTNFILSATDTLTGCLSLADTVVVVISCCGPLAVSPIAIPDTICPGEPTTLYANPKCGSGAYTFLWTSNPPGFTSTLENPIVSPLVSTTYIVIVDDGFTTFTDSTTVIVIPSANAGADDTICEDATYTLSGSVIGQSSVLWTTSGDGVFDDAIILGATYTPGLNDIVNGTVILTLAVTTTQPCVSTSTDNMIISFNPSPNVDLGNDTTICYYNTITLYTGNPGSIYLWSTGETTESITVSSPTPNSTIQYYVNVTDTNGCNSMDDIYVTFDACVSIEEITNTPHINIFPNPSTGKFNIKISNVISDMEILITNIHGQTVFKDKINLSYTKEIDLSMLQKGIYFINFKAENFVKTKRLVVK